jgi:hypothetical protein
MAWVTLVVAAVQAISSIQQAKQESSALKQNAKIHENNAKLFTAQATEQERKHRMQTDAMLARNRVGVAKSGVTMSGTPLLVAEDITGQSELDALTIRYNGEMKASSQRYQASVAKAQASNVKAGGYMSAVGSILGGVAGYANAGGFAGSTAGSGLTQSGSANLSSMNGGYGIRVPSDYGYRPQV